MEAKTVKSNMTDMTQGSPARLILFFALPLLVGNMFQQLYNMVDSIVVGRFVGSTALAAVGTAFPVVFLLSSMFMGLGIGAMVMVSQFYGAGDAERLKATIDTIYTALIVGIVPLSIVGILVSRPIIALLAVPADTADQCWIYMVIVLGGLIGSLGYNANSGILQGLGDSKTPLYFLILTSALNIGLDLLFVIPFKFGVFGAALATDISQVISGVLSFIYLCRKFDVLKMQKDDLAFSKKACVRLMGIGVPMGLQCSITAIGSVIMQWAVNMLGSTAVAAVTAAGKTQNLLTVPLESVGTAMATYAGQNLGASRMDRVRKGTNSAMLIILVYGLASAFILHFTDVQIMGLFLDTAKEVDIVAMGREYLFWNSVFFVPLGALIVWRYTIQGLGFSSLAMLAGVAEMIARTAVAIILVPILGYFGAELANPAAWVAACLFLYPAYRWTCRQLDNRLLAAKLHIQGNHAETVL